ncbi:MAG: hypothetical protein MN733_20605 [Nitrososphaera sp.]|nr:hypothetical protein [Nitrososphaera sp.]
MIKRVWWIYTELDDAGSVQQADTPEQALKLCLEAGWDPEDAEVWAQELKDEPVYLGVIEDENPTEDEDD